MNQCLPDVKVLWHTWNHSGYDCVRSSQKKNIAVILLQGCGPWEASCASLDCFTLMNIQTALSRVSVSNKNSSIISSGNMLERIYEELEEREWESGTAQSTLYTCMKLS